jgi:hypothetical protein
MASSILRVADIEFRDASSNKLAMIAATSGSLALSKQGGGTVALTNVGTPSAATDCPNKAYVDGLINGLKWKQSVKAASAANFACSQSGSVLTASVQNSLNIDGVTTWSTGDRILLKSQTASDENGIYSVTTAPAVGVAAVLTRTADADASSELIGAAVFVEQGSSNADTGYVCTSDAIASLNTSAIAFGVFSTQSLGANSVGATELADAAVDTAAIVDANVTTAKLADDAVTAAKLAAGAVDSAAIATNAVTASELADSSVDTAAIVDANVTTAKLADSNVTTAKLADSNVTTGKIADDAVTSAKIAAGAVDSTALASSFTVSGDIVANSLSSSSDATLKTDIEECSNALMMEKCKQLSPCTYRFKENQSEWRCGFIAQKVACVCPEFVVTDQHGLLGIRYSEITSLLCGAVKHLAAQVDELESKMAEC